MIRTETPLEVYKNLLAIERRKVEEKEAKLRRIRELLEQVDKELLVCQETLRGNKPK